ncbi:MAG: SDR family NAD(P)-dependent oxidoreductase [Rhodospirillaceae bacterium]
MTNPSSVFILSASSDIGQNLMERYLESGATVIGTYRKPGSLDRFEDHPRAHLLALDLNDPKVIDKTVNFMTSEGLEWDLFIAANATMEPIGLFTEIDGQQWQESIISNSLVPCRVVQALYPFAQNDELSSVCFMAGGGTNNPFRSYSAYCLSKIMLIKMCELLDDEIPTLKAFILGPGYVRTKIHDETLRAGDSAGANRQKTLDFLETEGTSMDDIFDCIQWCFDQDREVIGGRNVSVIHDPWRNGGKELASALTKDTNLYKLRRFDAI